MHIFLDMQACLVMTNLDSNRHFDFGENWKNFSSNALYDSSLKECISSLVELFQRPDLKANSFLDIGCGSGIFSIAARCLYASPVVGFDISKNSVTAAQNNIIRFAPNKSEISFLEGSILDKNFIERLGKFDRVYAWGSLHHSGDLWQALSNTASTVKDGGELVVAIYQTHWSSPIWSIIKRLYNASPKIIQKLMIIIFYFVILIAKTICTGKNPYTMKRGMSFYYDVVDWIGGYPYQYATKDQVVNFLSKYGLKMLNFIPATLPTGNHQYLFRKDSPPI